MRRHMCLTVVVLAISLMVLGGLGAGEAFGLTWKIEAVDLGVQFTDIFVDAAGFPHLGYAGASYARLDEERWRFQRVLPPNRSHTKVYTRSTSMFLDTQGYPHILYCCDDASPSFIYSYYNGSSWQFYEEACYSGDNFFGSLALDALNRPHLIYPLNIGLRYQYYDGTDWVRQTIENKFQIEIAQLKLDTQDRPHIGYHIYNISAGKWQIIYQTKDEQGWQQHVVFADGKRLAFRSLILDAAKRPHLVFSSIDAGYFKHAYYDGNAWQVQDIETGLGVAGASLGVDHLGRLHLAYAAPGRLKYAYYDGVWHRETVDQLEDMGSSVALALDSQRGRVHISYFDTAKGHLKYAHSLSDYYPESSFTVSAQDGAAPFTVNFADASTGQINAWEWDFGDGATSIEQHPAHTYQAPGNYDVRLTVTGPAGSSTKIIHNAVWTYRLPVNLRYRAYVGCVRMAQPYGEVFVVDCQRQAVMGYAVTSDAITGVAATSDGHYVFLTQELRGILKGT